MEQEQEILQQPLSNVINASVISAFLSSDRSHISIFDTLLGCRITGVDSEIRTEYENGKVVRFPVLTLCLDGLDRLLEKHELARQMLQEKINAEGGRPGVYGKLVQSLPIARTGFLCAGQGGGDELVALKEKMKVDNAEDLAKLKDQLEAEYAEKKAQLNAVNAREPANLEQTQDIGRSG